MKRTSLTTAVVAGLAGVAGIVNMASAVNLNPDGTGSVLIYPYYTVNGSNATLLSVVNTTDEGKAVKVRFLEAYDSREVLDFNLYMSPFDVWTAGVVVDGAGAGVLTSDNSCTVPAIGHNTIPFRNNAYAGSNSDTGPTDLSRTREGYVEMIEMGTVTNATDGSLGAITHVGGVPASCGQVVDAWQNHDASGYWNINSNIDLAAPDGGLFGSGTIVNVGFGTIEGYNADAIQGFYVGLGNNPASPQHTPPGSILPNLASGTNDEAFTFSTAANGNVFPSTTTFVHARDAVSAVFMADDVYNEYTVDPNFGESTEWVVTFPTKRFYVDPAIVGVTVIAPFDQVFGSVTHGQSCSPVLVIPYDREEDTTSTPLDFSPPVTEQGTALCYEAQVVTFDQGGAASTILGSALQANVDLTSVGFTAGWVDLSFDPAAIGLTAPAHTLSGTGTTALSTNVFFGLPATGFSVEENINANVTAGVLANYTALYHHKFNRVCTDATNVNGACS